MDVDTACSFTDWSQFLYNPMHSALHLLELPLEMCQCLDTLQKALHTTTPNIDSRLTWISLEC